MHFLTTIDTSSQIYLDAIAIRKIVFIEEQQVDESLEIDDLEDKTLHIVGYKDKLPICTARLLKKEDESVKIQRVAVLAAYRKKGVGRLLLEQLEKISKEQLSAARLALDSQDHAISFYEKIGYSVKGDGFLDAGIPHHYMQKAL
ncbi:GNAT family N-acetyltransferase [Alkalibacterium sp. 20]|uniref:GNAT family N-acetyltransferase n=1 Tax=Alkalibacterium sp. 20 TaxID=1798803 RepID=UPI00090046B3|nr:GNAT family N-acetyltransferase [Alkalibacterium sp. 20]OJF96490.1 acetyltransferase [Alkalibacterium sp. 20]